VKRVENLLGHVPKALAKMLYLMMKEWQILWTEAVITGEKGFAPEVTWAPRGGIELPCTYYIYAAKIIKTLDVAKLKKEKKSCILSETKASFFIVFDIYFL